MGAVGDWRRGRQVARLLAGVRTVGVDPVVLGSPILKGPDIEIGDRLQIWSAHRQTSVSGPGRIRIGNDVFINAGVVIYSEVAITIGDGVALANEAYIMDTSSHGMEGGNAKAAPVVIGNGSWIGARVIVLPGVTIGSRAVVGAGAVVTRDVPDDVLVAGNPARVVRSLTYPDYCKRAWHDMYCYCPGSLRNPQG